MDANTPVSQNEGASQEPWISPEFEPGLVSVIIPTYNRAHLIVETLDSVAAQTYRPIELIIVDDGSTDNTKAVVEDWIETKAPKDDFHVRFIEQPNAGAPAARNHGARESKGEFIQFLDSDDLFHREKLELQVNALEETAANWSSCLFTILNSKTSLGKPVHDYKSVVNMTAEENLRRAALFTPTGLYKRAFINKIGPWNENMSILQDGEYCFRIYCNDRRGVWLNNVLLYIRKDNLGISRTTFDQERVKLILQSVSEIEKVAESYGKLNKYVMNSTGCFVFYHYRQLVYYGYEDNYNAYRESLNRCTGMNRVELIIFNWLYESNMMLVLNLFRKIKKAIYSTKRFIYNLLSLLSKINRSPSSVNDDRA